MRTGKDQRFGTRPKHESIRINPRNIHVLSVRAVFDHVEVLRNERILSADNQETTLISAVITRKKKSM